MAKKFDPQAKAKRQKIIAAVGGVLLLGLLAFQVPRTMKMLHPPSESSSSSSSTPAATTPATASTSVPAGGGGNVTAAAVSGGDGLTDPDALPAPQSGQLLAFGRFRTKDPFVQQLDASGPTGASGATAKPAATQPTAASTPAATAVPKTAGSSSPTPRTLQVVASTARISVNGSPQTVQVGRSFPSADPVFKLVSLTRTAARVGIAGGSLESGAAAVTLTKGKALTLLNTADGKRYVLRLLSIS
jgi:hypothetical protein